MKFQFILKMDVIKYENKNNTMARIGNDLHKIQLHLALRIHQLPEMSAQSFANSHIEYKD